MRPGLVFRCGIDRLPRGIRARTPRMSRRDKSFCDVRALLSLGSLWHRTAPSVFSFWVPGNPDCRAGVAPGARKLGASRQGPSKPCNCTAAALSLLWRTTGLLAASMAPALTAAPEAGRARDDGITLTSLPLEASHFGMWASAMLTEGLATCNTSSVAGHVFPVIAPANYKNPWSPGLRTSLCEACRASLHVVWRACEPKTCGTWWKVEERALLEFKPCNSLNV